MNKFEINANQEKIQEILEVQSKQLLHWKSRLNETYYNALKREVNLQNNKLTPESDPFSIFRGASMENFISNTSLEHIDDAGLVDKVKKHIWDETPFLYGVSNYDHILPSHNLAVDLHLDSIDINCISLNLEEDFDICFPRDEEDKWTTVQDIINSMKECFSVE